MNKLLASAFYSIEVGHSRPLVRLIPLFIVVAGIIASYNIRIYRGFSDQQSMDNAQLARQLERHQGFLTFFIRPYALAQVAAFAAKKGQSELFPDALYPEGKVRTIPDTYNSPGYPVLLSYYFRLLHVNFDETLDAISKAHFFPGERWVPLPNQACILLTAVVMFVFGWRLFDERVAWMGPVVFLFSDFVWKGSLLAGPNCLLMLLMTLLLFGLAEVYRIDEAPFGDFEQISLGWRWAAVPALAALFGAMCLLSLPLVTLAIPLCVWLLLMPRTNWFLPPIFLLIVAAMVGPWFLHWYHVCGDALGSNLSLGLWGQGAYTGNKVFCTNTIPAWEMMMGATGSKEYSGFVWYFTRGWDLLGSNLMVLLFVAALLHEFRRRRVQSIRWLVVALAFVIVATTSLADASPDPLGPWNLVAILLPAMILIGAAFFFVLLDRMITQLRLLTATLVVVTLALSLLPVLVTFLNSGAAYYNYPPYLPPYLTYLTRLAPAGSWVTSDMPWANAWYGDRPSLWLPDSLADFTAIYDNDAESDFVMLTPVTLGKPATTLTSGELKEWMPLFLGNAIPPDFPVRHFVRLPAGGPEYLLLSNRFSGGGR